MTLLRVTASALAAVLLSGCAVTIGPSATPTPVPGQPERSGQPAAEHTWAYELVDSATRPADATSARLKGTSDTFAHSTSLWVGCDGAADEVVLATGGRFRQLFGHLGLRDNAPAGLVVHTLVSVDGRPVQNVQLDSDHPSAVELNVVLTGVQRVTFQSEAVEGECSTSDDSYAVLGDGFVE